MSEELWLENDDRTDDITIIVIEILHIPGVEDAPSRSKSGGESPPVPTLSLSRQELSTLSRTVSLSRQDNFQELMTPVSLDSSRFMDASPMSMKSQAYASGTGDWIHNPNAVKMALNQKYPMNGPLSLSRNASDLSTPRAKKKTEVSDVVEGAALKILIQFDDSQLQPYKLPVLAPKTPEQSVRLLQAMKSNILFDRIPETTLRGMTRFMEKVDASPGQVVFKQGVQQPWFYVVESGSFGVYKEDVGQGRIPTHTYRESGWGALPTFGEFSLLYGHPAQATVKAVTSGVLWKLHLKSYEMMKKVTNNMDQPIATVVTKHVKIVKCDATVQFLLSAANGSKLLVQLSPDQMMRVVEAMVKRVCAPGDIICRQGEVTPQLFIV